MGPGSTGSDVLALQNWLVSQGYLTPAQVATGPGTYGPQTKAAVTAWQNANHVDTQGNPGYFGPISRSFVQQSSGTSTNTNNVQNATGNTNTSGNTVSNVSTTNQTISPGDQSIVSAVDRAIQIGGDTPLGFLTRNAGSFDTSAVRAVMQKYGITDAQISAMNPSDQGGGVGSLQSVLGIHTVSSNATQNVSSNSNGSGGLVINGVSYDTGNKDTNAALQAVYDSGKNTVSQGYQLNPNLTLDQGTIDQFLTQATNAVHPYYAQQIKGIQDQLGRDTGQVTSQYQNTQADEQQAYKSNLGNAREQYAGNGLAFSGQRGLGETNMQNSENRTLNQNALNYGNQVGDLARNAEKQIGTSNMTGFQLPNSPTYSASLSGNSGGFDTTGSTTSSYAPGGYNVGSLTSAEQSDIAGRQNSLINSAYGRMSAGLSYQDLLK